MALTKPLTFLADKLHIPCYELHHSVNHRSTLLQRQDPDDHFNEHILESFLPSKLHIDSILCGLGDLRGSSMDLVQCHEVLLVVGGRHLDLVEDLRKAVWECQKYWRLCPL